MQRLVLNSNWNKNRRNGLNVADLNLYYNHPKESMSKVSLVSIPETDDNLRQSRRPSYVNLPPGGFISPSV